MGTKKKPILPLTTYNTPITRTPGIRRTIFNTLTVVSLLLMVGAVGLMAFMKTLVQIGSQRSWSAHVVMGKGHMGIMG